MAPIKNIVNDITSSERLKQQERVAPMRSEKAKKQGQVREGTTIESRKDTVDISAEARQLAETRSSETARYQEMLQAFKSDDGDKIQNVRERIAQGEFNTPEVLEKVAGAISDLPRFQGLSESAPETSESRELMGALAQRIRSGQYNSEEVLEQVAMNILRDIGAA